MSWHSHNEKINQDGKLECCLFVLFVNIFRERLFKTVTSDIKMKHTKEISLGLTYHLAHDLKPSWLRQMCTYNNKGRK